MEASDGTLFESKRCSAKYDVQSELVKSFLLQINAKLPLPEGAGTPQQIDVVVSGGGMKGYFVVGAWSVLSHLIQRGVFEVQMWSGTSVGAAGAIYMCCGVDPIRWSNTYWKARRMIRGGSNTIIESLRELSHDLLPDNADEICSGRVFLSITLLTMLGPKNVIVSDFCKWLHYVKSVPLTV